MRKEMGTWVCIVVQRCEISWGWSRRRNGVG